MWCLEKWKRTSARESKVTKFEESNFRERNEIIEERFWEKKTNIDVKVWQWWQIYITLEELKWKTEEIRESHHQSYL